MTNNATGKASVLTTLASGDNLAKLMTIGLIIISGGANFMETKSGNEFNAHEINRASQEIHELYPRLMQALENQNEMIKSNSAQLDNQSKMLGNQQKLLELLKEKQDHQ